MKFSTMALVLLACAAQAEEKRVLVEAIVVRVNERILTIDDVKKRAQERVAERGNPLTVAEIPTFLQELADELCLLERAAELKIEVDRADVEAAVKQLMEQNRLTDEKDFEDLLSRLGLTRARLEERLKATIAVNRTLQKEVGQLPVTEEELKARYEKEKEHFKVPEKVHLEHVVFTSSPEPAQMAKQRERARRLVAAARSGGPFSQLIQQEVAQGGAAGGDLGEVAVVDLRPEVAAAVAPLQVGEVSEPFESPAGVHVARVVARIPESYLPFAQVVDRLRLQELDERYRTRLRSVVDNLKKRYIVEIRPEAFPWSEEETAGT